jgi:hypothetical protein
VPSNPRLAAALRCAEYGWSVFPAPHGKKSSYKSAKNHGGVRWGATRDPEQLKRDWEQWPRANLGLPTDTDNGFFVIDADTIKGHSKDGLGTLTALEAELGPLPETLQAESPSGSQHRYFQHPKDRPVPLITGWRDGIDIKGVGGMVLAPPSRWKGGEYRWVNRIPIAELPQPWLDAILEGKCRNPMDAAAPAPAGSLDRSTGLLDEMAADAGEGFKPEDLPSLAELKAALDAIPNDVTDADDPRASWDHWCKIGMAIYASIEDKQQGFELFDEWSQKWPGYDEAETEKKWREIERCPPKATGFGKLAALAREYNPGWRSTINYLEKARGPGEETKDADPNDGAASTGGGSGGSGSGAGGLNGGGGGGSGGSGNRKNDPGAAPGAKPNPFASVPLTAEEWLARDIAEPDLLLGHILTTTTRAIVHATTGIGKTNFGMAMAGHIGAGRDFLHWRCPCPRLALYIDGEMSRRLFRVRIADTARRLNGTPTRTHFFSKEDIEGFAPLNTKAGQITLWNLIKEVQQRSGQKLDFIVLDSIMALLLGDMKEEDAWRDTQPLILGLTKLEIGQLWVHHTGHDTTRGYGTKTREWQVDTVMHLDAAERPETDVSFTCVS